MREVPLGEHAVLTLQTFDTWSIKETEYGPKFCLPITLFSHSFYESIPTKGMKCNWLSKCGAAEEIYYWIYEKPTEGNMFDEPKLNVLEFPVEKEIAKRWKLTRFETGVYKIEQL